MADALAPTLGAPSEPRPFRIIPALERDRQCVAFVQMPVGRLLLFLVMLTLSTGNVNCLLGVIGAAAIAYLPKLRAPLMLAATVILLVLGNLARSESPLWIGALFAFAALVFLAAARVGRRGPFARPVPSLFFLVLGLALLASMPALSGESRAIVWTIAGLLASSMWFLAYAVANSTGKQPKPVSLHLALLHPFWGSTPAPFGKGAAYVSKFEAHDAEDLAVTQIKAAKLLLWARLLGIGHLAFDQIVHGPAGVPRLVQAVSAAAAGHPFSRVESLLALPAEFVDNILALAVMGHTFVAVCRYAGFRIPRNMCRPLEARTIAEFWNRYYFYFKELLVDFFFLPAFARLQRWPAQVRLCAATFFAAGVGNYLYHFFRDIDFVRTLGWRQAIVGSGTYAFYCVLLAAGISCSQIRKQANSPSPTHGRASAAVGVVAFYCFVNLFAYDGRTLTLADHFRFLLYLGGIQI